MKLKPQLAFVIALAIFVLGVVITSATGLYQTTTTKTPGKIEVEGYADQNDPADIKGSYTFGDISRLYGVPMDILAEAFKLGGGAEAVKVSALKSLDGETETETELGPPSVRLFVAYYLGLPYEPTEDAWLPGPAAELLLGRGTLTPEQTAYVEAHTLAY